MISTTASLKVAYLGPEASFSHQAVVEAFPKAEAQPFPSFKAILAALQQSSIPSSKTIDFAVLPVENSTNGSVVQALDLIAQCGLDPDTSAYPDVEIVDEKYLAVHHCLFVSRVWASQKLDADLLAKLPISIGGNGQSSSQKLSNGSLDSEAMTGIETVIQRLHISTIYSHPQVWGQCNNILSEFLPPGLVDRVDTSSTSAAAAFVKNADSMVEGGCAAISSALAGAKHVKELVCVAQNIEDDPGSNTTRFLVLKNKKRTDVSLPLQSSTTNGAQIKSLWVFTIAHFIPGSLTAALAVFAKHNFNLCAIQSRPRPKPKLQGSDPSKRDQNWRYIFFVECLNQCDLTASDKEPQELERLLIDLQQVTEQVKLLGSWKDRLWSS